MFLEARICVSCIHYSKVSKKNSNTLCPYHTVEMFGGHCNDYYEREDEEEIEDEAC